MSAQLHKPAVLITSGTKRLGLAMTRQALLSGFDVIAQYRSSAAPLMRLLRSQPALKARIRLLQADITPENAALLIREALPLCRTLAGLVNNASLFTRGNLTDIPHLRQLLDANALIPAALACAFARQCRRGWVIHVTDAHVTPLNRSWQNYRLSKLLLTELTRQQAFLYAPTVRVNAIAPGAMLAPATSSRAAFNALARRIPLRRTGSLAALQRAFDYLATADYVTGQVLYVDGGWHLCD